MLFLYRMSLLRGERGWILTLWKSTRRNDSLQQNISFSLSKTALLWWQFWLSQQRELLPQQLQLLISLEIVSTTILVCWGYINKIFCWGNSHFLRVLIPNTNFKSKPNHCWSESVVRFWLKSVDFYCSVFRFLWSIFRCSSGVLPKKCRSHVTFWREVRLDSQKMKHRF